jgi:hypothetical protein
MLVMIIMMMVTINILFTPNDRICPTVILTAPIFTQLSHDSVFSPATCCHTTLHNSSEKEVGETAGRTPAMKRFQIPAVVAKEVAVAGLLTSWSGMNVRTFRRNRIPPFSVL